MRIIAVGLLIIKLLLPIYGQLQDSQLVRPITVAIISSDDILIDTKTIEFYLILNNEEMIKNWAKENNFILHKIEDGKFVLIYKPIAYPLFNSVQNFIDLIKQRKLLSIHQLGEIQLKSLSVLLTSKLSRVFLPIPNLHELPKQDELLIGIQPMFQKKATIYFKQGYRVDVEMDYLLPLADPDTLSELYRDCDSSQAQSTLNISRRRFSVENYKIIILNFGGIDPEERKILLTIGLHLLTEEQKKDYKTAENFFELWRSNIAREFLDAELMNWVSWDTLSNELKARLREELIGRHLTENLTIDAAMLDSKEWLGNAQVRFEVQILLQILKINKKNNESTLYLCPIGKPEELGSLTVIKNHKK